jgi:hypothetical protein
MTLRIKPTGCNGLPAVSRDAYARSGDVLLLRAVSASEH